MQIYHMSNNCGLPLGTIEPPLADFLIHPAKRENLPWGIVRRLR
jgi:hypothetical protein